MWVLFKPCWVFFKGKKRKGKTTQTKEKGRTFSEALSANATGQLNVLGHDGDALAVDGAEVGVLEETDEVGLGCLLKGQD